jgi:hypothetical protein
MSRNPPIGPRVAFKSGEFGARLYGEFFEPGPAALVRAFALEAPPTKGGIIVVTSVWRKPGAKPSQHPELMAVDVRTGIDDTRLQGGILGATREVRYGHASEWAARVQMRLGSEYDVVFGAEVRHVDHIHGEWDRRKRRRHRT